MTILKIVKFPPPPMSQFYSIVKNKHCYVLAGETDKKHPIEFRCYDKLRGLGHTKHLKYLRCNFRDTKNSQRNFRVLKRSPRIFRDPKSLWRTYSILENFATNFSGIRKFLRECFGYFLWPRPLQLLADAWSTSSPIVMAEKHSNWKTKVATANWR